MITSNTNTERNIRSKSKPPFIILLLMLFFIGIAGCSDSTTDTDVGNGNGDDNGGTQQGPDEVWMEGRAFNPDNLEVEVGTTVTWENKSNEIHTVTSGSDRNYDEIFDSGDLNPGQTFSYTFDEVGEFDYFCRPHVVMTATITVIDNS